MATTTCTGSPQNNNPDDPAPVSRLLTKYVVQDTWDEEDDQELREYLEKLAAEDDMTELAYLNQSDIMELQPKAATVLFVDSKLVQTLLPQPVVVVDTYPEEFQCLYKRRITKTTLRDMQNDDIEYPYFIKRQGNDMEFAHVSFAQRWNTKLWCNKL